MIYIRTTPAELASMSQKDREAKVEQAITSTYGVLDVMLNMADKGHVNSFGDFHSGTMGAFDNLMCDVSESMGIDNVMMQPVKSAVFRMLRFFELQQMALAKMFSNGDLDREAYETFMQTLADLVDSHKQTEREAGMETLQNGAAEQFDAMSNGSTTKGTH